MDKKDIKTLAGFFTDKQNLEIKKELLTTIHRNTTGASQMSEEKLDKVTKMIRYLLRLYDTSDDMSKQIKQMKDY